MALANSSFPVPVSPESKTVDFDALKIGIIPVAWRKHLLVPISAWSQLCIFISSGCLQLDRELEGKVEFNAPVRTAMKCLRVLVSAFEGQIEDIDRDLDQGTGLNGIELIVPHSGEVSADIPGTATLFALVHQPGLSHAPIRKPFDIRIRCNGVKNALLLPTECFELDIGTHEGFVTSWTGRLIFLLPAELRPDHSKKAPRPSRVFQPQRRRDVLQICVSFLSIVFERVAHSSAKHLNEGLEALALFHQWGTNPEIREIFPFIIDLIAREGISSKCRAFIHDG